MCVYVYVVENVEKPLKSKGNTHTVLLQYKLIFVTNDICRGTFRDRPQTSLYLSDHLADFALLLSSDIPAEINADNQTADPENPSIPHHCTEEMREQHH